MKEIQRRLAAIMFTDIVGYTAMMQKDEVIATRLRERHREVFSSHTHRHGGQILQYYGDGTLSIFPSSAAAVECAVDIQRELKQEPPVPIRIGIHTGDINIGGDEIFGDGVNVASRIESLCVPGGIFISGKVYDDIKNHPPLKSVSLGSFELKNIHGKVDIFAIANEGIAVPKGTNWRKKGEKPAAAAPPQGRKKKFVAGLLALLFGVFGIHRFYLGQRNLGLIYLGITLSALFIIPGMEKLMPVMGVIGFVDAILFWTMTRADFNAKFNQDLLPVQKAEAVTVTQEEKEKSMLKAQFENYKSRALKEFKEYDYEEAIILLKKAAALKNDDPEVHFLLACCYSVSEKTEEAFLHLDAAVASGLKDVDRIQNYNDLAYLRMQPKFEDFAKNGYRLTKELPAQKADKPQPKSDTQPDLLEQLSKLQKVRKADTKDSSNDKKTS